MGGELLQRDTDAIIYFGLSNDCRSSGGQFSFSERITQSGKSGHDLTVNVTNSTTNFDKFGIIQLTFEVQDYPAGSPVPYTWG